MLVLAVLLGADTGFLLSALKSSATSITPILPVLFLFSISSGAAVALIAMAIRRRSNPHSTEAQFVRIWKSPWYRVKLSCWWRFFLVWRWAMTVSECAGGGIRWRFLDVVVLAWCRRAGADCANVAQTIGQSRFQHCLPCWRRVGPVWSAC